MTTEITFDTIENAGVYRGLYERLSKAFDILIKHNFDKKQQGRYEVDGEKLFYIVANYTTKPIEQCKLEAHEEYVDIQFIVKGCEQIGYSNTAGLKVKTPYDADKDLIFYHVPENLNFLKMQAGSFAIFFPDKAHLPCCQIGTPCEVKKVVFKVKIDV